MRQRCASICLNGRVRSGIRRLAGQVSHQSGHGGVGTFLSGGVDVEVRCGGAEPSGAGGSGFNPAAQSRAEAGPTVGNVSEVRHDCVQETVPLDYAVLRFEISGLRGGHSGIDIQLGRGNAIKLMDEALHDLSSHTPFRLIEMNGGTACNAIPREAFAVCALPVAAVPGVDEWVEHRLAAWQKRFADIDENVDFRYALDESPPAPSIAQAERDRLLVFLDTAVNGVARMSEDFPGVVDTSSNLGVLKLKDGELKITFKVRSLRGCTGRLTACLRCQLWPACLERRRLSGLDAESVFAIARALSAGLYRAVRTARPPASDSCRAGVRPARRQSSATGHDLFRPGHPGRARAR